MILSNTEITNALIRLYGCAGLVFAFAVRIPQRHGFLRRGPNESRHEISNNVVCATSKGSDQPAHTRILIRAFASHLNIL